MALDEPKPEDLIFERGVYKIVFDPQITSLIRENGGLAIDYVDEVYRKGYLVTLKNVAGGCDSGGCSC